MFNAQRPLAFKGEGGQGVAPLLCVFILLITNKPWAAKSKEGKTTLVLRGQLAIRASGTFPPGGEERKVRAWPDSQGATAVAPSFEKSDLKIPWLIKTLPRSEFFLHQILCKPLLRVWPAPKELAVKTRWERGGGKEIKQQQVCGKAELFLQLCPRHREAFFLMNGKGTLWDLWFMKGSEAGPRQTLQGTGQADFSWRWDYGGGPGIFLSQIWDHSCNSEKQPLQCNLQWPELSL